MANTIPANNNTGLYNSSGNSIPISGNVYATNIFATGQISAAGNIISGPGSFFIGDGGLLSNITAGTNYSNANVAAYLPIYSGNLTANVISATGNISGQYFIGNGSQLTGLPASYGNANVAAYLPTYTGNLAGNNLSLSGNVTSGNISSGNLSLTGNIYLPAGGTNPVVIGQVSAVTGTSYMPANSIATGNSLANAVTLLSVAIPSAGTYQIDAVVRANWQGSTAQLHGAIFGLWDSSGTVVANTQVKLSSDLSSTTTNSYLDSSAAGVYIITAPSAGTYTIRGWSNLQGGATFVSDDYGYTFATYTRLDPAFAISNVAYTGNISYTGNITSTGNVSAAGNVTGSNLFTTGVVSATGNVRGANFNTTGLISATGNITGNYLIGDGSLITNLPGGSYGNANVAAYLPTYSGALAGANLSVTGNVTANYHIGNGSALTSITGANVTGTVANATTAVTAGTVTTAAQPNITSVGTLTSLTSTGNVSGGNILTGGFISATGNVTGNYFIGNGSALTGITTNYSNANVASYLATYSGTIGTTPLSGSSYPTSIVARDFTGNTMTLVSTATLENIQMNSNINWNSGSYFRPSQIYSNGNILAAGFISATGNVTSANLTAVGQIVGTYTPATTTGSGIVAQGANTQGGAGYFDFLKITNQSGGATNPNKTLRLNSTGGIEIIDSAYTTNLFSLTNAGALTTPGTATHGAVTYSNVDGTAGQVLTTYGNGQTYFSTVSGNGGGTYGNSNVANFMAAFGSNVIQTSGNVTTGNLNATVFSASGNVTGGNILTVGLVSATGNVTGGNILTAGVVSAAGNISGNILIPGTNSRLYGTFGGPTNIANRTYFQSSANTNTLTGAIAGVGYTVANGTVSSAVTALGNTDPANTTVGGVYVAYGNASTGFVALRSSAFGSATLVPIQFQFGSTEKMRLDSNGNLGIGNTAPVTTLAVTGTAYVSGNVTMASLATVGTYTVTALTAITGVSGQYAAVSNGTGKNGGQLAYWDTTNTRWSWVDTNLAVS